MPKVTNDFHPSQPSLFAENKAKEKDHQKSSLQQSPLAHRIRPNNFNDFAGQSHLFQNYPFLKQKNIPSMIIWGPPGTGKTTLAYIIAAHAEKELYKFSAVLGGVNDLKKMIQRAYEIKQINKKETVIFIDEIHRFNKAQQDALLPFVEEGQFTLIGATTENPRVSINRALLSRLHIIELKNLNAEDLLKILRHACQQLSLKIDDNILSFMANHSSGDARNALNFLEIIEHHQTLGLDDIKQLILENTRAYDRNQDRHYDVISAFIKSLRGSDPDAAILWLAVMLDGGEDPVFIARRLVIFASEDVGNADPSALTLATSALTAVSNIGMPEARIILAQATCYLASTYKSNATYMAINKALAFVKENETLEVPYHLKSNPPHNSNTTQKYKYPHDYTQHWVKQQYTPFRPASIPSFYLPTTIGKEKFLKDRLNSLA